MDIDPSRPTGVAELDDGARSVPFVWLHGTGWRKYSPVKVERKRVRYAAKVAEALGLAEMIDVELPLSVAHHAGRLDRRDDVVVEPPSRSKAKSPKGKRARRAVREASRERAIRLGDRSVTCACCSRSSLSKVERKQRKRNRIFLKRALKYTGLFKGARDRAFKKVAKKTGNGELIEYLELSRKKRQRLLSSLAADLPDGPFVLAGHSMGSVVALELAAHLPAERQPLAIVTSGTPLDWRFVRKHLLPGVRRWCRYERAIPLVNVRDRDDIVTKCESLRHEGLGPVIDIKVVNRKSPHSASGYLTHTTPYLTLAEILADGAGSTAASR